MKPARSPLTTIVEGNQVLIRATFVTADGHEPADPTELAFVARRRGDEATAYVFGIDAEIVRMEDRGVELRQRSPRTSAYALRRQF